MSDGSAAPSESGDGSETPSAPAPPPAAPKTKPSFVRRHKKKLIALGVILLLPFVLHVVVGWATRIAPPTLPDLTAAHLTTENGVVHVGKSYKRMRGKILEVRLVGTPAEIGDAHSKLLHDEMVASEGAVYTAFEKYVPLSPVRHFMVDLGKMRFRHLDQGISTDRFVEIAAQARAFDPDPFEGYIPTFQRFIYLQSLYDISLSFEHSPLLGCTSFVATRKATADSHTYLARNFDFEAGPIYDERKTLFLVEEDGKIPYASVAWPGFIGAVSGINAKGVSVVIHGGRARETSEQGEPVVQTTRAILGEASTLDEAIAIAEKRRPMVSHILIVADASGRAAAIERAPGEPPYVRAMDGDTLAVTNHFEGPFASDPKNQSVRQHTSTVLRRDRLDELLAGASALTPEAMVAILRDKKGTGGADRPLGNRGVIDAVIATHAVVMDSTASVLWVSEGPHLMGRFVRFDLAHLLDPSFEPTADEPVTSIAEDPALTDGTYDAWVKAGSKHPGIAK